MAADMVEESLPAWTRITEDESSHPDEFPVLACWHTNGSIHIHEEIHAFEIGDSWRPLNDYDYPPKDK